MTLQAQIADGFNRLVVAINHVNAKTSGGSSPPTWIDYATSWSSAPTKLQAIASGDVWQYTYSGQTLYRLVPSPYISTNDAFYTTFTSGVLSNKVVSRA